MEKQQDKQIIDLDEFDSVCSLWQLIPAGSGAGLKKLKLITESILNSQIDKESPKPLSLIISGKYGKRTHGRCWLRTLGITDIREIAASTIVDQYALEEFFHSSTPDTGFIISNAYNLKDQLTKSLYQILNEGMLYRYNLNTFQKSSIPVVGTVVMTTLNTKYINWDLKESFSHQVEIEEYDSTQIQLLCLQRLLYSKIGRESDKVLELLTSLRKTFPSIISLLKNSVLIMLSEGDKVLKVEHIEKASYFK